MLATEEAGVGGEGGRVGALRIRCLLASIKFSFSWANFPQRRKTICSLLLESALITALVSFSQPRLR